MVNRVTARLLAGVRLMYRVTLCAALAFSLAACSLNSSSVSTGLYSDTETRALPDKKPGKSLALGGEPATSRVQTASLTDKAPRGSFENASKGALADRDYAATSLDNERARDLINQYRSEKGLKPLRFNVKLTEAAKEHCRDLAKWDRISHYGSDGSNPWDRVKRTGYKARLAAENVGTGQINFDEVLKGWKESPGHDKNLLLADGQEMGLALVQDPKTEFKSFWTLVVGTSM